MANDPPTTLPGAASDNAAVRAASDNDFSWIQKLKEARDERVASETVKIGMPTWGDPTHPTLAVEFRVVDKDLLEKFQVEARQRRKETGAGTDIDIQFIASAAAAVWIRNPDTDKLVRAEVDGQPVRLDTRLARLLGLDPDTEGKNSKTLLMYLVRNNTVALGALAVKVANWMTNTSREVEDEVLGE